MAQLRQLEQVLTTADNAQAETARIVIPKLGAIIETDDDMVMLPSLRVGFDADQFPGHA
jgi:hypothetical protein